jgi:molecular chaperone HtpG
MSAQPKEVLAATKQAQSWVAPRDRIVIGKDVLELLSSSMYVDPMTIYREYVQNAADAIDLGGLKNGRVAIDIDPTERRIRIRDNGVGVPAEEFASRLMNLGASVKRGTAARGFRGVGRLAGLGYCQELVFRSKSQGERFVSEMKWDCRRLRSLLRSTDQHSDIIAVLRDVVTLRKSESAARDGSFFEVELSGVVRQGNDRLLNKDAVASYLAQVAPVPFSPEFRFAEEIKAVLGSHGLVGSIDIRINGASDSLYRPHRDLLQVEGAEPIKLSEVSFHELPGVDGDVAAVCWVAHHEYAGAISSALLVKGLRVRSGNIQVGDFSILEELFPETRFNSWSIGEVHILDKKIIPNGRRDHFEQGVHYENLTNQLAPVVKDIARRCRQNSISRKWVRTFELHRDVALERGKVVARGGISRATIQMHADAATKALKAMRKVIGQKLLADEIRNSLAEEAARVEARVTKMLKGVEVERDPLKHFPPSVRHAYQDVISLVYECVGSRSAAGIIVEKILDRLETKGLQKKAKPKKTRR